ncbi:F-box domain protein [Aulographum hederae CBS 113979]|uniref:F-box domain protein n=1 Tax=Aulographum hederae CBS 113979 TaxID=1176131 RepID=A0A6G1H4U6_9PEZI|nr:F-box domain protein [Aulographum hederae CBS 113979]
MADAPKVLVIRLNPISISNLPNEIIQHILSFLSPECLRALQLTSRAYKAHSNEPLLWRGHCKGTYKYWHPQHCFSRRLQSPAGQTDWKELFYLRKRRDRQVRDAMDRMVDSMRSRTVQIEVIAQFMNDAKDELLRHCHTDDSAEDVLARRYWARKALTCINRRDAIQTWADVRDGLCPSLERALNSFDLFVLGAEAATHEDTGARLDEQVQIFRRETPLFEELTTRKKAFALVEFMRSHDFEGMADEAYYGALRTNFIGIAMKDPKHQTIPLITVAIFCALAQRLGLDATPCGYPWHVYAIVDAPFGTSLDGAPLHTSDTSSDPDRMYLDPYRTTEEVSISDLRAQLSCMGVPTDDYDSFLAPASLREIIFRTARNIIGAVDRIQVTPRQRREDIPGDLLLPFRALPDIDDAYYASLWSMLLAAAGENESSDTTATRLRHYFSFMVEHFEIHFPEDVKLFEDFMLPLYASDSPQHSDLTLLCRTLRHRDVAPRKLVRRDTFESDAVRFRVGTLFKHKRYGYVGVVRGWDTQCEAGDVWMAQMGVERLERGGAQSFYHVLVEDKSVRYVAEENILPVMERPTGELMEIAGKYFRRWDDKEGAGGGRFVSNLREEYPDD